MKRMNFLLILLILVFLNGCGDEDSVPKINDSSLVDENTTTDTTEPDTTNFDISYNGLNYNEIVSPFTSRVWLDRNLGARELCDVKNNIQCYGDYYQWGRITDGHEKSSSGRYKINGADERFDTVNVVQNEFFIPYWNAGSGEDWVLSGVDDDGLLRGAIWAKSDSGICPDTFRVPTDEEISLEISSGAFGNDETSDTQIRTSRGINSFLKLPAAGNRNHGLYARLDGDGSDTLLVTSSRSVFSFDGYYPETKRGVQEMDGHQIRCIKDN